jgi:hypothetical protein
MTAAATGIQQTGKLKMGVYDGKCNHFELFLVPAISEGKWNNIIQYNFLLLQAMQDATLQI